VSGRREYGGKRAEAGTGMNRNKLELNRKSTTLLTNGDGGGGHQSDLLAWWSTRMVRNSL
jgi:hypothetical protein